MAINRHFEKIYNILKKTVDISTPLVHNKGTFFYAFRIQQFKYFLRVMDALFHNAKLIIQRTFQN